MLSPMHHAISYVTKGRRMTYDKYHYWFYKPVLNEMWFKVFKNKQMVIILFKNLTEGKNKKNIF